MKALKFAVAVALFVTTITIDKQLTTINDGQLVASWNVSLHMNWGHANYYEMY
jgi:hypothetical protein